MSVSLKKEMKVTLGMSILDRSGWFGNEVHVDGVVWLLGLCHGVTLGIPIHLVHLFLS